MASEKPTSISWFQRLHWLGFSAYLLDEFFAIYEQHSSFSYLIPLESVFTVLLWYLIAVRAKNWARLLYIILAILSAIFMGLTMITEKTFFVFTNLSYAWALINLTAAFFLLRPDTEGWFLPSDSTEKPK